METDNLSALLTEFIDTIIHRSMSNIFLFSKTHHISGSQLIIMNHLYARGPASVSSFSQTLGISNSAVSQLLEKLVRKNLISRWENPEDRRMKYHAITDEGASLVKASREARYLWIRDMHQGMNEEKRQLLVSAMTILMDEIELLEPVEDFRFQKEGSAACSN